MKKEYKSVFIDTAPLIYLLDNDKRFVDTVKSKLMKIIKSEGELVISSITVMEYLVIPYREKRFDRITSFYRFIEELNIRVCDIDVLAAERAAQIRSQYASFKGLDSLQLACAEKAGCDCFLTNDKQLNKYDGISIDTL